VSARRTTIRDVARQAGVSTTTVSDALAGRGRLSEQTRADVRAAADAVGYVASTAARNLRLGRSGSLGLYLPDRTVGFEYYTLLARGAAEAALGHGYALTLVPAWNDARQLAALHLDGLIVSDPLLDDPVMATLRELPVPMMTVERDLSPESASVGMVHSEHAIAARTLLRHLHDAGADKVAVITPDPSSSFGVEIHRACDQSSGHIATVDIPLAYEPDEVRSAVMRLLGTTPQALVVAPAGAVHPALQQLQIAGLRVPDDILVASCVDGPSLATSRPAITAVDIDPGRAGAAAVEGLLQIVRGDVTSTKTVEVSATLRVRESTQPDVVTRAARR
jgi:DNA-binding LacI/PurR family transcriptional regulator